jgi:hypothetical protein
MRPVYERDLEDDEDIDLVALDNLRFVFVLSPEEHEEGQARHHRARVRRQLIVAYHDGINVLHCRVEPTCGHGAVWDEACRCTCRSCRSIRELVNATLRERVWRISARRWLWRVTGVGFERKPPDAPPSVMFG